MNCSTCGSPLPISYVGLECNACKLLKEVKKQNESNLSPAFSDVKAEVETFGILIIVFLVFFFMADWGLFDLWITHNIILPIFKFIWAIISFVPKALGFIRDFFIDILGEKVFIGLIGAAMLFYIVWKKALEK